MKVSRKPLSFAKNQERRTKDRGLRYSQSVMHRPPQLPSILSASSTYQWISRVNQKFQELSALNLSQEKKKQLKNWIEVEFITSTLRLENIAARRERILPVIQALPDLEQSVEQEAIKKTLSAFRRIEEVIEREGQKAKLNVELLLNVSEDGEFRQTNSSASSVRAQQLALILDHACRWFAMDSFAELNPVEQAAIVLLRLSEIAPFERHNEPTSRLAASLFTMRSGLPPLIFQAHKHDAYVAALREGLRMNTQPMVELLARSVEQTLDEMMQVLRT